MTDGFLDAPAERKPPEPVRKDIVKNIAENITEEAPVQKQTIVKKIEETAAAEKHEYMDCAVAAENFYPADYGTEMNATTVTTVPPPKMQPPEKAPVPVSPIHGGKFYAAIKSQLDELFENYPREEYLCQKLIGTDWVKVDYDNDGRYYTVGLIADEDRVKYICYGVPGKFAKLPPPELKGFCQWLPFDAETPEGEGYWMMYQDADSGKSVTLEII